MTSPLGTRIPLLTPLNRMAVTVRCRKVNSTTNALVGDIESTVTAFVSLDGLTPLHPSLIAQCTNVSSDGKWRCEIAAELLTPILLKILLTEGSPVYFVIQQQGEACAYVEYEYRSKRAATLVP